MLKITTKKLIFVGYFLAVFVLGWLGGRFGIVDFFLWFTGIILGGYFIKLEQLVYVFYIQPQENLSLKIKELLKEKRRKEALRLLRERVIEQKLAFRSAVFQVVWALLAFFTLTSTSNVFGKALVMAIGLHLLLDEWESFWKNKSLSWLFWQVKRVVSFKEQKYFLWLMTGVFGVLSLLLI